MRNVFLFLPCAAVLIGMSWLRSAWAAILLYHAVLVFFLFVAGRKHPLPGLLHGWNTRVGTSMIALCALSGPLLVLLWPVISNPGGGLSPALDSFGLHGAGWWLFAAYFVSVHPVLEELFWRNDRSGVSRRITIPDAAFASYHVIVLVHFLKVPWVIIVFVILTLVSWLWRRIAEDHKGLAIPLFSHVAAGLGIMMAVYIIVRG